MLSAANQSSAPGSVPPSKRPFRDEPSASSRQNVNFTPPAPGPRHSTRRRRRRAGIARASCTFHSFGSTPRGVILVGSLLLSLLATTGSAGFAARGAATRFDTSYLVSCRDVTTPEFASASPQDRLVEARFQVTAIVDEGDISRDMQCIYRFQSPTGRLRVVDYRPKTRQSTALAGNVSIEKKKENTKSLGVSLSGSFEHLVRGTAGTDLGSKDTSSIRYELKPPMEVVVVSGTIERGTGVYFKMRPSPDRSLEGAREFVVVMRVSQSWRGDVMYVRCEAQQNRRGKADTQSVARFVVGLYAEGDEEARDAAEQLVLSETRLRHTVSQHRQAIARQAVPSVVHRVGALLDVYDPRIPDTWLDRVIYGSTSAEGYEFYDYLPQRVRQMADRYRHAKRKMYQLSGHRLAMREVKRANG